MSETHQGAEETLARDDAEPSASSYEDLGDIRTLTKNARASATENNRGHG